MSIASIIPYEYAKVIIKQKEYSKEVLLQSVLYLLDIKDDFLDQILYSISENDNYKQDKILFFTVIFYLYTILMNSYTLVFKEKELSKLSINVNNYFNKSIPAINIYGETLVNLSLGILLTESLDVLTKISDNNILKFGMDLYDEFEGLYKNQLNNDLFLNIEDSEKIKEDIIKYDNLITNIRINIINFVKYYGNDDKIKEIKENTKTQINTSIN